MIRIILELVGLKHRELATIPPIRFNPEPPPGFVPRSDPNFYFLARKF